MGRYDQHRDQRGVNSLTGAASIEPGLQAAPIGEQRRFSPPSNVAWHEIPVMQATGHALQPDNENWRPRISILPQDARIWRD